MTLRILEDALMSFDGASVVISHDRALLDRAATAVLSFEGDGTVIRYASRAQALAGQPSTEPIAASKPKPKREKQPKKGLTWAEERELEGLPEKLEALEAQRDHVGEQLADPALYRETPEEAAALGQSLKDLEADIAEAYARWESLESRA